VPGITTEITVTPTETGNFRLICTELCGLGHALMRTRAIVTPAADFERWLSSRTTPGGMS
jgi:cytochrome c oxidase subunit 2